MSKRPYPHPVEAGGQAARLLEWYDRHRRVLPWRMLPGEPADPYYVWLSEIMLQQTTVATVKAYYERFIALWPRVEDLASASLDEVLHAWQGLGYYSRARNLHACAKIIATAHGGKFPADEAGLLQLPGIGAYTAAAIASIAFDRQATVLDGNVERVMARLYEIATPLPVAKPILRAQAERLTPVDRPGDYAQAVMDLGATICVPRKPRCMLCPWSESCAAHRNGQEELYPVKASKRARPSRQAFVFWLQQPDGSVMMRKRAETGLLGGLMEFPSSAWQAEALSIDQAIEGSPVPALPWQPLPGHISHVFTHFRLELQILAATLPEQEDIAACWVQPRDFSDHALPTLMKKVAAHALDGLRQAD